MPAKAKYFCSRFLYIPVIKTGQIKTSNVRINQPEITNRNKLGKKRKVDMLWSPLKEKLNQFSRIYLWRRILWFSNTRSIHMNKNYSKFCFSLSNQM